MLIMDINAIPRAMGMDVDTWAKLIREQGVCFFDSTKGERPSFMNVEESIKVFDVEEEEAMGELERIMADDNYDPELPPIPLITPTPEEEANTILEESGPFPDLDSGEMLMESGSVLSTTGGTGITINNEDITYTNGSYIMGTDPISDNATGVNIDTDVHIVSQDENSVTFDQSMPPSEIIERYENLTEGTVTQALEEVMEVRTSRRRQTEPGFELTDDTDG